MFALPAAAAAGNPSRTLDSADAMCVAFPFVVQVEVDMPTAGVMVGPRTGSDITWLASAKATKGAGKVGPGKAASATGSASWLPAGPSGLGKQPQALDWDAARRSPPVRLLHVSSGKYLHVRVGRPGGSQAGSEAGFEDEEGKEGEGEGEGEGAGPVGQLPSLALLDLQAAAAEDSPGGGMRPGNAALSSLFILVAGTVSSTVVSQKDSLFILSAAAPYCLCGTCGAAPCDTAPALSVHTRTQRRNTPLAACFVMTPSNVCVGLCTQPGWPCPGDAPDADSEAVVCLKPASDVTHRDSFQLEQCGVGELGLVRQYQSMRLYLCSFLDVPRDARGVPNFSLSSQYWDRLLAALTHLEAALMVGFRCLEVGCGAVELWRPRWWRSAGLRRVLLASCGSASLCCGGCGAYRHEVTRVGVSAVCVHGVMLMRVVSCVRCFSVCESTALHFAQFRVLWGGRCAGHRFRAASAYPGCTAQQCFCATFTHTLPVHPSARPGVHRRPVCPARLRRPVVRAHCRKRAQGTPCCSPGARQ